MAVAKRKKTGTRAKTNSAAKERPRRTTPARASRARNAESAKALLPYFLSFCLIVCLGGMGFLGYRTATASDFFDVKNIEILGTERASKENIHRIVRIETEKTGAWDADLGEIKAKIEKLQFVKVVAVSRVLPDGIRVVIDEKVPAALVKMRDGVYLVDGEGNSLAKAEDAESQLTVVMTGWNEEKSPKADEENKKRLEQYAEVISEWHSFDLVSRVSAIDLSDLREPRAVAEDSGLPVVISLGRENFGEHLKSGLEAIGGKGAMFEGVELRGPNMILAPRKK